MSWKCLFVVMTMLAASCGTATEPCVPQCSRHGGLNGGDGGILYLCEQGDTCGGRCTCPTGWRCGGTLCVAE